MAHTEGIYLTLVSVMTPKQGLVFFWRKNLYYDFESTGKTARYALLASKYNGKTWSDVYLI